MKEELLEFATKIWAKYGAEIWAKYGAEMGAKYRAEMGAEIWDTQVLPFTSLDEERALPDSLFERIRSLFFFDAHSLDRDRVWMFWICCFESSFLGTKTSIFHLSSRTFAEQCGLQIKLIGCRIIDARKYPIYRQLRGRAGGDFKE
jgi:hypothetical protein